MIKKLFNGNKVILFSGIAVLFLLILVILYAIKPSSLIQTLLGYNFNNPEKINKLFYKQFLLLFVLSAAAALWAAFYKSRYYLSFKKFSDRLFSFVLSLLGINTLLAAVILYLVILLPLAVWHYDFGYDEAVYIEYAKYFAKSAVAYITVNEKITFIDTIAMLPYYIASVPNFLFNLTEVWHFKFTSTVLSVFALIFLFRLSKNKYSYSAAVIFIFFLCVQPGFGFIASSYFGELLQAVFLLWGFSMAFSDEAALEKKSPRSRNLLSAALLISLAVHTKFQLAFIVTLTLASLYLSVRKAGILKLLGYTVLFSALISAVRSIPVFIMDYTLLRRMILLTDIFAGPAYATFADILDKFQLFNKFFPLPLFIIICTGFYYYSKNIFERAVLYFSVVTVLWWILLYPLTTYRNPFMGIITICLMAAVLAVRAYNDLVLKYPHYKRALKVFSAASVLLLISYGYSANMVYAYIGYNDGVQFDLDGFKSRLFSPITHDRTQKDFYEGVRNEVPSADTIYNGTWVAQYYLPNPVGTFDKMKESLSTTPGSRYMLITRDFYPLGFEKIYSQVDSLGVKRELIFSTPKHELYRITKESIRPR